jgi:hypothetical protein
MGALAA